MKTKIISSIAMLMMLIITSCIYATHPYQGWIERNDSTYLMINGKYIPVDSGISYEVAHKIYLQKGKPFFIRKVESRDLEYNLYGLYDGKKIYTVIGEQKNISSSIMNGLIPLILAILVAIMIAFMLRGCKIKLSDE